MGEFQMTSAVSIMSLAKKHVECFLLRSNILVKNPTIYFPKVQISYKNNFSKIKIFFRELNGHLAPEFMPGGWRLPFLSPSPF